MYTLRETRKIIKEAFADLEFNEEEHKYNVGDFVFDMSTTGFIGTFYEKFRKDFMAYQCAKKWNRENPHEKPRTKKWFIDEWDRINKEATTRGTRIHLYGEMYPNLPEPQCAQEKGIEEFWKSLGTKYQVVGLEVRMYDMKLNQVGTADILLRNRKTKKLVIADYKTNRKNLLQLYGNKKMKFPFIDFEDISLNHYKLQLSNYQMIIENRTDLEIEDRWVVWLHEGNHLELDEGKDPKKYKIIPHEPYKEGKYYKIFQTPDLSERIKKWIFYKKKKKKKK